MHHDQLLELVELDLAAAILVFEELGQCCLLVLRQTVAQVVTDGLGELPGVKRFVVVRVVLIEELVRDLQRVATGLALHHRL